MTKSIIIVLTERILSEYTDEWTKVYLFIYCLTYERTKNDDVTVCWPFIIYRKVKYRISSINTIQQDRKKFFSTTTSFVFLLNLFITKVSYRFIKSYELYVSYHGRDECHFFFEVISFVNARTMVKSKIFFFSSFSFVWYVFIKYDIQC